jgi:PPOX class probable F420-dependent enzyme
MDGIGMRRMSEHEWSAFVREGTRTGKLSVNLPSGRPTITPVWFIYEDDGVLRINTGASSAKARALTEDPRACLIVDLEEPPYAYVRIDAIATIVDEPELTRRVATEVGRRYMGEELAEAFGERNSSEGQVTLEFRPSRVTAIHDISD